MSRRFHIETWGCQMNELDSQRMTGLLVRLGMVPASSAEEADLVLLNTCSVREKAVHKVRSRLGELRVLKRSRPGLQVGLCGCVAQQMGEDALGQSPAVDFVIGPGRIGEIQEILSRKTREEPLVAIGFPSASTYDFESIARDGSHKGMVTVIEGCNQRCTYCVVPTTRGSERCRSLAHILQEVRHLLDQGFVEIELLGQTVNHWIDPDTGHDFSNLLHEVAALPGLRRLRFLTSYPGGFTNDMVEAVAQHSNICSYLHLPVQSGSDRILRLMGRGYRIREYRDLVGRLRAARSDLALSTDFIVGFPGETDDDFQASLDLVEEMRFSALFAFVYSPRPDTPALRLPHDPVPREVASRRLQELLARQGELQLELNAALVDCEMDVLITGQGSHRDSVVGRTSCHRIVHVPLDPTSERPLPGHLVPVIIEKALPHSLLARLAP